MHIGYNLGVSRETWALRALTFCLLLAGITTMYLGFTAVADAGEISLGAPSRGAYELHVVSYAEMPFRTVIHQQYDYSCGSAALATLLHFHYGQSTNEAEIFKAMYAVGDQPEIQKYGFSLLDMKKLLEERGYKADGYQLPLDRLARMKTPAIALIQLGSYKHFVVIKGIIGDRVLVGDPATGLKLYDSKEFTKIWNGIAFMIHGTPDKEYAVFNGAVDWSRWSEAHPLSAAVLSQPLAPFTRDLRVVYQIQPNQMLPSPFVQ